MRHYLRHPWLIVGLLSLFLLVTMGKASVRVHDYLFDGKMYYVGGRILLAGGDPYDGATLRAFSARVAPEGLVAGAHGTPQLNLPGTLVAVAPFSLLPWTAFCWVLAATNCIAIALSAYLCLRAFDPAPTFGKVGLATLALVVFPATWQNMALGQLGLYSLLAASLLFYYASRPGGQSSSWGSGVAGFLALIKFTNTLPLLCYIFYKGQRKTRLALSTGIAVYALLNVVGITIIGVPRFMHSYSAAIAASFSHNMTSSPENGARIDLENFVNVGVQSSSITALKVLLVVAVLVGIWWKARKDVFEFSALVLCLTVLVFYHRSYDIVLLYPALLVAIRILRVNGSTLPRLVIGGGTMLALAGCLFSIGYYRAWNKLLPALAFKLPGVATTALLLMVYCLLLAAGTLSLTRRVPDL